MRHTNPSQACAESCRLEIGQSSRSSKPSSHFDNELHFDNADDDDDEEHFDEDGGDIIGDAEASAVQVHAPSPGEEDEHFTLFATGSFGGSKDKLINYRDYCVGLGWRTKSDERFVGCSTVCYLSLAVRRQLCSLTLAANSCVVDTNLATSFSYCSRLLTRT